MFTVQILPEINFVILLTLLLIFAIQFEEKLCAVAFDVTIRNVTVMEVFEEEKRKAEIFDIEPLLQQVRRNADQNAKTSGSYETLNLGEVLQAIHAWLDPKLYQPTEEESDEEDTLSIQDFKDVHQALVKDNAPKHKLERHIQHSHALSAKSTANDILQTLYKNVPKHSKKQHSKYSDYLQKLLRLKNARSPVYKNFLQLLQYRNFFNDNNDEDGIQSDIVHDNNQNPLDNVVGHNKSESTLNVYYISYVPTSRVGKEFSEKLSDGISLEQQDRYPENKHRHRRSPQFNILPAPEHSEGSKKIKDNDIYYEDPKLWPHPPDGQYDADDPRNPKHPLYGLLWSAKFVPQRFISDDYQPFLGTVNNPYPHPSLIHGQNIFLSQAVPLLKSMILGTGIEQGPKKSPFRVHRIDIQHYRENADPPPPGPRFRSLKSIYIDQTKEKITTEPKTSYSAARGEFQFYNLNTTADFIKENVNDDNDQKKHVPKKLVWWPRNKPEEKNKFNFDENTNYTLILNIS